MLKRQAAAHFSDTLLFVQVHRWEATVLLSISCARVRLSSLVFASSPSSRVYPCGLCRRTRLRGVKEGFEGQTLTNN